jgi:hypothetical protein
MATQDEEWTPADLDDVRATLGEPELVLGAQKVVIASQVLGGFIGAGAALAAVAVIDDLAGLSGLFWALAAFALFALFVGFYWLRTRFGVEVLIFPKWIVFRNRRQLEAVRWASITSATFSLDHSLMLSRQGRPPIQIPAWIVRESQQLIALVRARVLMVRVARIQPGRKLASLDLGGLGVAVAQSVRTSEQIACELRHDYVGTEHLLLALLRQGRNDARDAIERLGISPARIRESLEKTMERSGAAISSMGELPITPMLMRTLQMAKAEQLSGGDGTPAILLAIFSEPQGVAAVVLTQHGLTFPKLRDAMIKT